MNLVGFLVANCLLLLVSGAAAADLHPIVEVQTGYLFGATVNGKWMKAENAAKAMSDEATYRIYGLTQSLGQARGGKPKRSEEDVCSDVITVELSPKPENGAIALAAPWNALPRKPQVISPTHKVYVDAVRDFLQTKGIKEPKTAIENILRIDLDGDGEEEVLISATNYFQKKDSVPMRSPAGNYSMVLLRRGSCWKSGNAVGRGRIPPPGLCLAGLLV